MLPLSQLSWDIPQLKCYTRRTAKLCVPQKRSGIGRLSPWPRPRTSPTGKLWRCSDADRPRGLVTAESTPACTISTCESRNDKGVRISTVAAMRIQVSDYELQLLCF